jgi:serine/threonine protein kinase
VGKSVVDNILKCIASCLELAYQVEVGRWSAAVKPCGKNMSDIHGRDEGAMTPDSGQGGSEGCAPGSEAVPTLTPGMVVGPYVVDGVLGRSTFVVTYLASDLNLRHRVALKEYLPQTLVRRLPMGELRPRSPECSEAHAWGKARFLDEARVLARFRHPNIVRVLSFHQQYNTAYFAMDFEQGQDLGTLLEKHGPLAPRDVPRLLLPLLDGLEVMHAMGFIHRDVKPSHIIVRRDFSPVLLGFGVAFEPGGESGGRISVFPARGYAAPEQYVADAPLGGWTDIYSLAAVFYQAVTGERPVEAGFRATELASGRSDPLAPIQDRARAGHDPEVLRALEQALAPDYMDRPQSVGGFRELLPGAWTMGGGGIGGGTTLAGERPLRPLPRELRHFQRVLLCSAVAENARVDSVLLQTLFSMRTRHVTHGAEALSLLHRESFDLALCDVGLADMHAAIFLEAAALRLQWRRPPLFVLSYDDGEELKTQVVALGGLGLLKRPYGERDVERALRRILALRGSCSVEESLVTQARRTAIQGRHARAIRLYRDLLEMEAEARNLGEPGFEESGWRSMQELASGETDRALESFSRGEMLLALVSEAHAGLAEAYRTKGAMERYLDQARQAADKARLFEEMFVRRVRLARLLAGEASLSNPFHALGTSLAASGDKAGALRALSLALEQTPHAADIHCDLATLHLQTGERHVARKSLDLALRYDPENERARDMLRRLGGSEDSGRLDS